MTITSYMYSSAPAAAYLTSDTDSFAFPSARERTPKILSGALEQLNVDVAQAESPAKQAEGVQLAQAFAALRQDLLENAELRPIASDGGTDIAAYNDRVAQLGHSTWLDTLWLFSECFLYRHVASLFRRSLYWRTYDVFRQQKLSALRSSVDAMAALARRHCQMGDILGSASGTDLAAVEALFMQTFHTCLWGNATDLSLHPDMSSEDIQNLQVESGSKSDIILVDDLKAVHEHLVKVRANGASCSRVDIVLDNAGFELFTDLILAAFLIRAGLAKTIVFHPKDMPWFVSDVTERDFFDLIASITDPESFFPQCSPPKATDAEKGVFPPENTKAMQALGQELHGYLESKQIVLRSCEFWTRECSFWELKTVAPELYEHLRGSQLVLFKGDLNYRKLTADARWNSSVPLSEAIGCLGVNSGVQVLALRTCKSDVVVGLPEGKDELLREQTTPGDTFAGRQWAWDGQWAVAQFSDGGST